MYEAEVVTKAEYIRRISKLYWDVGVNLVGKGWKKDDSG